MWSYPVQVAGQWAADLCIQDDSVACSAQSAQMHHTSSITISVIVWCLVKPCEWQKSRQETGVFVPLTSFDMMFPGDE